MTIKSLLAVSTFALTVSFISPMNALASTDEQLDHICQFSAGKLGLDSSALESMVSQCKSRFAGRTFETDEPVSDDDAYAIEERCAESAQENEGQEFEQLFEKCLSDELLALLDQVSG
ncbi:hypothetical protein [Pleionea sediminis]|uniref:hypothetical protein n=1 Tax=Pleionea sediminis TaxID=2569479 RepID=UPI0011855700|nr:hypothetical protein [Pleionea sediminis]